MTATESMLGHFTEAARRRRGAPAIRDGSATVSYEDSFAAVEDLAAFLARSVQPGQCVAFSLPKGPAAVLLMLACLRAAVPYVPIDAAAPAPRRLRILADCRPALLFAAPGTAPDWSDTAPDGPGARFERLDSRPGSWSPRSRSALFDALVVARRDGGQDGWLRDVGCAYILYTSGSTGVPKGVVITAANVAYFVDWTARAFPLTEADQVAQHAPLHFDLPVYDVFGSLTSGACLHLMDGRTVLFPAASYEFLRSREITAVYAVPSALNSVVRRSPLSTQGLPALRQVLYAGEEYHPAQLAALSATLPSATRIHNLYGPVETNVITWHEVDREALRSDRRVPIGRPPPGTDVQLRAEDGALTVGAGEIVAAGPSVSPGYLHDEARTEATRLRVDGQRVYYRTGDYGSFDDRGVLYFQGRRDGMVKVRGFRVELGDVEATIAAHPLVAEVAVSTADHPTMGTVLVAHVVPVEERKLDPAELRQWAGERLPAYMVPASVHPRERLPHTSTGKIARTALSRVTP